MRYWVVGGGSIGLLFAARLNKSGSEALLITRTSGQAGELGEAGISVTAQDDVFHVPCQAAAMEQVLPVMRQHGAPEWILLTVKQYGLTEALLDTLGKIVRAYPDAKVLAMQNGIGHLELLSEYVPPGGLYAAVVSEGAKRTSRTSVSHTGKGITRIGAYPFIDTLPEQPDKNIKELQKVLQNAGFQTVLSNNLMKDIWHKLIINSVINPLTALLQIRNGELLEHDGLLSVMRRLYDEAFAVAVRSGVHADATLWETLHDVCRRTAGNRSSMLQDLEAGRPTELMWINGAIVRLAENLGIPVPTHETIVQLLRAKEEIR